MNNAYALIQSQAANSIFTSSTLAIVSLLTRITVVDNPERIPAFVKCLEGIRRDLINNTVSNLKELDIHVSDETKISMKHNTAVIYNSFAATVPELKLTLIDE